MKSMIRRRPYAHRDVVEFCVLQFVAGLFILFSFAVHEMQGTLSDRWLTISWGAGAGYAMQMFWDIHFQQQWLRLLRLRVPSVHVQQWIAGHFQWISVRWGLWSLTILWVATLCGYSLMQASALIALNLVGLPLFGFAGLVWMGHGPRALRWPVLLATYGCWVWLLAFGWKAWRDQGLWVTVFTLVLALAGMWGLMRLMMRLGEPAPVVASSSWTWKRWLLRAWAYLYGQGRWVGLPWMGGIASGPLIQFFFKPSQLGLDPAPHLRVFALSLLLLWALRSDRHHWRYRLMPRLRLRQAWAYEIWAATLRWVLTLALPLLALALFVWQWRTGMAWLDMLQNHGHWLHRWGIELAVAAALAVWMRSWSWKRWPDLLKLLSLVALFVFASFDTARQIWTERQVGHDLLLLLAGWVFLALANRNLQRHGLPDWGQPSPSWGRAPEPT